MLFRSQDTIKYGSSIAWDFSVSFGSSPSSLSSLDPLAQKTHYPLDPFYSHAFQGSSDRGGSSFSLPFETKTPATFSYYKENYFGTVYRSEFISPSLTSTATQREDTFQQPAPRKTLLVANGYFGNLVGNADSNARSTPEQVSFARDDASRGFYASVSQGNSVVQGQLVPVGTVVSIIPLPYRLLLPDGSRVGTFAMSYMNADNKGTSLAIFYLKSISLEPIYLYNSKLKIGRAHV